MPDADADLGAHQQIVLHGFPDVRSLADVDRLRGLFATVAHALDAGPSALSPGDETPRTSFFSPEDVVMELDAEHAERLVHGLPPADHDAIEVADGPFGTRYIARVPGYLLVTDRITLASPVIRHEFEIRYRFLPVSHGRRSLLEAYHDFCSGYQPADPDVVVTKTHPLEMDHIPDDRLHDEIAVRGVRPQPGADAQIKLVAQKADVDATSQTVDYRSFYSYITAEAGSVVAEKIPPDEGREGVRVDGSRVPVEPGSDVEFVAGDHVLEEERDGLIAYVAEVAGVVKFAEHGVSIAELMVIEKDVDLSTGNIIFSGDVVVKGSLTAGFQISCWGDLLIGGTVESGARIRCEGNLTVKGGVIGSETVVYVGGNCDAVFIQEARFYCAGDVVVQKSVLNADVFAKGSITVPGKGIKGDASAVVGGVCASMRTISVRSAGSYSRETSFVLGYDRYARAAAEEISGAIHAIEREIAKSVERIGFDVHGEAGIARIRRLKPDQRLELKTALIALKQLTSNREKLRERERVLRSEILVDDPTTLAFTVAAALQPTVRLQFAETHAVLSDPAQKTRFTLIEGKITATA